MASVTLCGVGKAPRHGVTVRQLCVRCARVMMPDHVHVVLEPRLAPRDIMRQLKGRTAQKAGRILGRRGLPFWQDESFDRWIRSPEELAELIRYAERNPFEAGHARRYGRDAGRAPL